MTGTGGAGEAADDAAGGADADVEAELAAGLARFAELSAALADGVEAALPVS